MRASKLSNMTYSIIARSCNRLMIGKTFWKGLGLATVLYGAELIDYTEKDLICLQRIENAVYRTILQVPTYTASSALRGEVGATSAKARDMKIKILFSKHLLEENRNQLIKEIFLLEYEEGKAQWIRLLKKYMKELDLKLTDIEHQRRDTLIEKVKEWDTKQWLEEMEQKSTLHIYRKYKRHIQEEKWIDNTEGSKLLVRGRTNSLTLNWRNRHQGKSEQCPACGHETETLEHFLLECASYNTIKTQFNFLQELQNKSSEEKLTNILILEKLTSTEIEDRKSYMKAIWKTREKKTQQQQV